MEFPDIPEAEPASHDAIMMKGAGGYLRQDVGEYRIVYRFDESTLYLVVIGKRNGDEVYKKFEQKGE